MNGTVRVSGIVRMINDGPLTRAARKTGTTSLPGTASLPETESLPGTMPTTEATSLPETETLNGTPYRWTVSG
jgi:hypothetical protein